MFVETKPLEESDEDNKLLYQHFKTPFRKKFILAGETQICMPESFSTIADDIRNLEVHNSDVFVASYPKTGSTWSSEMIWLIVNNLDFERAQEPLLKRAPFLDRGGVMDQVEASKALGIPYTNSVELVKSLRSPRVIKTHLPFSLLPEEITNQLKMPKIIYVTRNPKDTCISYYHHSKLLEGYRGNFEDYCTLFLEGKVTFGCYWKNILSFWEKRHWPNVLFISFEEMKKDLAAVIRKVASFLGKLLSEIDVSALEKHLSFESMKSNKAVNGEVLVNMGRKLNLLVEGDAFIRAGTVGQYKEKMTPQIARQFDEWVKKHTDGKDFTLYGSLC